MKSKVVKQIDKIIEDYNSAMISYSWKGGGDPDDIPSIEKRAKKHLARKEALLKYLEQLFEKNGIKSIKIVEKEVINECDIT